MRVGVAIAQVEPATGAPIPVSQLAEQAEEAEALGFDSVWLMDHIWIERAGQRLGGHEPIVSLAYIAARTSRIGVGVLVLNNAFRHPVQLARELVAMADASAGRFIAGIGAGWHDPEFEATGLPNDHKVGRLAESLPAIRSLLRGERVSLNGRWLQLPDASVITTGEPPPIWIAAARDRMLDLTARYADGWNLAWGGAETAWFAGPLERFKTACNAVGRTEITVSAGVQCIPDTSVAPGSRFFAGSVSEIARVWESYRQLGVDHLIANLSESPFVLRDRAYLAQAGKALRELRDSSNPRR